MKLSILTFCYLFLIFPLSVQAQKIDSTKSKNIYNHWFGGINTGMIQFYGDLSGNAYFPGSSMKGKNNWFINPRFGYMYNNYIGVQISFLSGNIWSSHRTSGNYFHANVNDYMIEGLLNLTTIGSPKKVNKNISVFWSVGIGILQYRTVSYSKNGEILDYLGYDANLNKKPMVTERLVSTGVSFRYKLSNKIDVGLNVNLRLPPTDKLDAIYKGNRVLSEYDRYSYTGVELNYSIGKGKPVQWNLDDGEITSLWDNVMLQQTILDSLNNDIINLNKCKCAIEVPADLVDNDFDGVPDSKDLEPNTPKGSLVNFQGKKIPIIDTTDFDFQSYIAGINSSKLNTTNIGEYRFSVYFNFNDATIDNYNSKVIMDVAYFMLQNQNLNIFLVGNCDTVGSEAYNKDLSYNRANEVKRILVSDFSIDKNRIAIEALGESKNLSKSAQMVNRRVDFYFKSVR